ncbi:MAG TPA: ornithine carbamoyltransferase [Clostridiales bacterium]|nr:ornithine carbamoyltransferase [Clostridiales bacterium]
MNLRGRSFLSLLDYSPEEIRYLLDLSHKLKKEKAARLFPERLKHKNIVLIFDKASTRTRCAFEVAALDEGAHVTFLSNSQMGKKESLEDTAKVLGRYYDAIEYRGFGQQIVEDLARFSGVPVWNGLTGSDHPTQVLADLMTIEEYAQKPLNQIHLCYVGDARNNMGNSLMIGCAKMGMAFTAVAPRALWPNEDLTAQMLALAKSTGAKISFSESLDAVAGADAVYTDVWVSMGEESQFAARIELLEPYRVTMELMQKTGNPDVLFLHCLPSFHDLETVVGREVFEKYGLKEMEVSDEVFRSRHSVVFDEAENRMHTIKAVMVATLSE